MKSITTYYKILTGVLILFLFGSLMAQNQESVMIGTQNWSTKNLSTIQFRNGDEVTEIKTKEDWMKAIEDETPGWCYYDNNSENGDKYGLLYNWFAVNDPRGLAPTGWHIPNASEWRTMIDQLGGEFAAGKKMMTAEGWKYEGIGDNSSGFTGLPSGQLDYKYDGFSKLKSISNWWCAHQENRPFDWSYMLWNNGTLTKQGATKTQGLSVRCVED